LEVGTERILWHGIWTKVTYLFLMYGWYILPFLLLLGVIRFLALLFWLFVFVLLSVWVGTFRLQSRFFGSRLGRRMLQMHYRLLEKEVGEKA
jgi:hypothetical protein